MNRSSNSHDEVCFDGHTCPVCEMETGMLNIIDTLQEQINEKDERIQDLTSIIEEHAPEELI